MTDLVAWLTDKWETDRGNAQYGLNLLEGDNPPLLLGSLRGALEQSCRAVLADIAVKRAIIAMHTGFHECPSPEDNCGWVTDGRCSTLLLLASAYADRAGYDEEWRP